MALVRVYCGVATAEMAPWLTVAVVDDSGRLLDVRHISDDPAGYAYLGALLADRSGGVRPGRAGPRTTTSSPSCSPPPTGRSRIADETQPADFAERFADDTSYEEMQAPAVAAPRGRPGPRAAGRRALRHRPEPVVGPRRAQAGARRPRRRDRRPPGRRGRAARGAARALPGRAAGLSRTRPSSSRCGSSRRCPSPGC